MPYAELPFSPTIIGSTKIVEGDFDDCLKMLMVDIEEEYKFKVMGRSYLILKIVIIKRLKWLIYVSIIICLMLKINIMLIL